ncbi:hypothetical protein LJC33_00180 [Eubacteriales bacterium OttesenSCG-928-N13]|nr:hypothetical protein [Eubacteriales bacterium OttesenSCG-928-N13]
MTVYENAVVAAAKGMAAVNAQIDAEYDKQLALMEMVCLDSTSVKVHPNGTGALKKLESRPLDVLAAGSQQKFIWSPRLTVRL